MRPVGERDHECLAVELVQLAGEPQRDPLGLAQPGALEHAAKDRIECLLGPPMSWGPNGVVMCTSSGSLVPNDTSRWAYQQSPRLKGMTALGRVSGQPTWLLSRANARAQQILHDAFGREGLPGYHYRLLAALDEFGHTSQADLGRRTGIDRSDIVAAVNDLVASGLVSRTPDADDRRRNVIAITSAASRRCNSSTLCWPTCRTSSLSHSVIASAPRWSACSASSVDASSLCSLSSSNADGSHSAVGACYSLATPGSSRRSGAVSMGRTTPASSVSDARDRGLVVDDLIRVL